MKWIMVVAVVALLWGLVPNRAQAITAGQVDTFESGTTLGWGSGAVNPHPPENIPTGGPAGGGDRYLSITSDGSGAGGRLTAFNDAQWAGDYTAAGVTTITMDVNNLGSTTLQLRLSIADSTGRTSANEASTAAITVPAGSGWMAVSFTVDAGQLTGVSGSVATALANAQRLWLYHSPNPSTPVNITAILGVDNIRAVASVQPFTQTDVVNALQIVAGLIIPNAEDMARLNIEDTAAGVLDLHDVARLSRKVAGTDPNP